MRAYRSFCKPGGLFFGLVLSGLVAAAPAGAADSEGGVPDPDRTESGRDASTAPEEIVVYGRAYVAEDNRSATKTATPLIETPLSISVIGSDLINAWKADKLTEALRYTPGVSPEPYGLEPRYTNVRLRGFDARTTGFFRDGLVLGNPGGAVSYNLDPWGAERIEVPRGPASVLYGQGSPGGLINYRSKRPTGETIREIGFEFGSYDRMQGRFDFAGSLPGSETLAYRLTGLVRNADTQIDHIEDDRVFLAPSFAWRPGSDTSLTLFTSFQQDDTKNSQALPAAGTLRSNPHGSIPPSRFTGEPDVDEVDRSEYSIGYLFEHAFDEAKVFRQNLRYNVVDLDDVVIYSNGLEDDLRTIKRAIYGNFGDLDGFTLDNQGQFDFEIGASAHTLLVGVDYQRMKARSVGRWSTSAPDLDIINPVYGSPASLPAPFKDDDLRHEQLGIYVQDQIRISDRFIATLGARYDDASSETKSRLYGTKSTLDDEEFTYRFGLTYLAGNGFAPYFSYTESFLPTEADFEPETGRQYELGIKFQPAGASSFVTLALFDLERQNIVEWKADYSGKSQIGERRARGVEIEGIANFDFGLDLVASYTYLDTETTKSPNLAENGKEFSQIPERAASIWAEYGFPSGDLYGLGFGLGVRYQSSVNGLYSASVPDIRSPSITLVDASLHYNWGRTRFQLNAHNLLDKEYVGTCFARSGDHFCATGEGRTLRASVRYKW